MAINEEQAARIRKLAEEKAAEFAANLRQARTLNEDAANKDANEVNALSGQAAQAEQREAESVDAKEIDAIVSEQVQRHLEANRTQDPSKRAFQPEPGQAARPETRDPQYQRTMLRSMLSMPSSDPNVKEFQRAWDAAWLARKVLKLADRHFEWEGGRRPDASLFGAHLDAMARNLGYDVRTLSTDVSGQGEEWAFDEPTPDLTERLNIIGGIEAQFLGRTIPRGRKSVSILVENATAQFYRVAEQTAGPGTNLADASQPGTGVIEIVPGKVMARVFMTEETVEDWLMDAFAYLQGHIAERWQVVKEHMLINGDVAATLDDDSTASSPITAFDGLRKLSHTTLSTAVDQGSNQTVKDLNRLFAAAGKYAAQPGEGMLVVPVRWLHNNVADDDVRTLDKMGNAATLLTGAIASVYGRSVFVSGQSREDLDGSGVNSDTPANNDHHSVLYAYRRGFEVVRKREFRVETDKDIERDQHVLVASTRLGFSRRFHTTEPIVVAGYGYDNEPGE
jgi:hypothetical protein